MSKELETKGVTVTCYAIRRGWIYWAEQNGKKHKTKPIPGVPYHVGFTMTNVVFK